MLKLKLFGAPFIEAAGEPVTGRAARGHRLALLALLAVARARPVKRDRIIALLWPESATERARHQLSDTLYILRAGLGADAIGATADDLVLNPLAVTADVAVFEQLLDEGRLEAAVELFTAPLLEGFHLRGSVEFEAWLDAERSRLAQRYSAALERLAVANEERQDFATAARWWRSLATHEPYSGRVAGRLMRALAAAGDRAGALKHARVHTALLREEFQAAPDPEMVALAERLRGEPAAPSAGEPAPSDVVRASSPEQSIMIPTVGVAEPAAPSRSHSAEAVPATAAATAKRHVVRRATVGAALLLAVALLGFYVRRGQQASEAPSVRTLAVLPFVNMSPDPDNVYFSDGLSEQVIAALSRIDGLRVAARTSSFAVRGRSLDVREIGEALRVGAVVEGSVRRDGDRLRVTVQLIDAASGYHIWTADYDRESKDIITVQDEIARAVARALKLRFARGPAVRQARFQPGLEAYDLYLRGLFLRNSLRADALRQSQDFFERAIELEPEFASAYAAKASVVGPLIYFGHVPREQGLEELREAVARALDLDPNLGEAHASLGILRLFFNWDWSGAEQALRRAIELNPSDSHSYHMLGRFFAAIGRFEDAVAVQERAWELDPLNARTSLILGSDYLNAGDFDRALLQYRHALDLDPANPMVLGLGPHLPMGLGLVYLFQHRHEEAVEEYIKVASLRGASASELQAMRIGFAEGGMSGFWRNWLTMDLRQSGSNPDPLRIATLWALIRDTPQSIQWLDRAYETRNPGLVFLQSGPAYPIWRAHPRFAEIFREMNFPTR